MGRPLLYNLDELSGSLYDTLADNPAGMTKKELVVALGVPAHVVSHTIRHLRLALAGGESIAVPYRKDGRTRRYFLTTDAHDLRERDQIQLRAQISRNQTEVAHWTTAVANADGRTVAGRLARIQLRGYARLLEDQTELYEAEYGPLDSRAQAS